MSFHRFNHLARRSILEALLAASCTSALYAQITAGRIGGTVTDTSGAIVSGATVAITDNATGISQTAKSGISGDYIFQAVNPGVYTLTAEAPGFQQGA